MPKYAAKKCLAKFGKLEQIKKILQNLKISKKKL